MRVSSICTERQASRSSVSRSLDVRGGSIPRSSSLRPVLFKLALEKRPVLVCSLCTRNITGRLSVFKFGKLEGSR